MNGYIFRCSQSTYEECLRRNLFGQTAFFKKTVSIIKRGDVLFLYNTTLKELFGEFIAASDGQENIEANAWQGRFPWQVRIDRSFEYNPIRKNAFSDFITFDNRGLPEIPITDAQIYLLRELFKIAKPLPPSEVEFLDKFERGKKTTDGHRVASKSELIIDNWLFENRVWHIYEPKLPTEENVYGDFAIISKDNKRVYLEYWGMEDLKRYKQREETKHGIYKENSLPLIDIFREDMDSIDEILRRKLRSYIDF